jgi:hypothetical protein
LALSNFGSCSYFIGWYFSFVAKALALTFPSTAQKSVMPYFYKAFAKYARKPPYEFAVG